MRKYKKEYYQPGFIPDERLFYEEFMKLNQEGNPKSAYASATYILREKKDITVIEGNECYSFGYLLDKYRDYLEYIQSKNAGKDPKYISKADKLKPPDSWLASGGENNFYNTARNSRDFYLLTNYSKDTLIHKLKIFLKMIGKDIEGIEKIEDREESPIIKTNEIKQSNFFYDDEEEDTPF